MKSEGSVFGERQIDWDTVSSTPVRSWVRSVVVWPLRPISEFINRIEEEMG